MATYADLMLVTWMPLARAALHTAEPVSCQSGSILQQRHTNESVAAHDKDLSREWFHGVGTRQETSKRIFLLMLGGATLN